VVWLQPHDSKRSWGEGGTRRYSKVNIRVQHLPITARAVKRPEEDRTAPTRYNQSVPPRIAIPVPHSTDPEYAERSLPQYERAVEMAGGEPVRIPLDQPPAEVMKLIERCDAVLLPGSKADVDPAKYDAPRDPQTAAADAGRDTVDELLLQDAYNMRKPVLGICYGLQILNVYRTGTLIQHIESPVNHAAGRKVAIAHTVEVAPESKLQRILQPNVEASGERAAERRQNAAHGVSRGWEAENGRAPEERKKSGHTAAEGTPLVVRVNSSHHQAAGVVGDGLRAVARSPQDGVIEALEGTSPDHFVLAVQWHPERSVDEDEPSRAIFHALVDAARVRHEKLKGEFESV
jgi:putative glutamine amidotransferase